MYRKSCKLKFEEKQNTLLRITNYICRISSISHWKFKKKKKKNSNKTYRKNRISKKKVQVFSFCLIDYWEKELISAETEQSLLELDVMVFCVFKSGWLLFFPSCSHIPMNSCASKSFTLYVSLNRCRFRCKRYCEFVIRTRPTEEQQFRHSQWWGRWWIWNEISWTFLFL